MCRRKMTEIRRAGNTRLSLAGSFIDISVLLTHSDAAAGGGRCRRPIDLVLRPSSDWRGRWSAPPLVEYTSWWYDADVYELMSLCVSQGVDTDSKSEEKTSKADSSVQFGGNTPTVSCIYDRESLFLLSTVTEWSSCDVHSRPLVFIQDCTRTIWEFMCFRPEIFQLWIRTASQVFEHFSSVSLTFWSFCHKTETMWL